MRTLYFSPGHCSSFFLTKSQLLQIVCLPYFHTWCGLSANLECISEMCCTWLAGNAGPKKSPSGHHRTTLSGYIFATKACIDNWTSLGHPYKLQWVSCLGSITVEHSSSGHQLNVAALNRGATYIWQGGHHVGVLAHISSYIICS